MAKMEQESCSPSGEARRNLTVPNGAESDADQDVDLLEIARKEARMARNMAYSSLLMAGVAFSAMIGSAMHPGYMQPAQLDKAAMLDETIYPTVPGIPAMKPGWAQTLTNAVLREGVKPDSPKVAVIRQKGKVYVEEVRGRRVRISKPVDGWLSSASTDGIEILRDLRSEDFKAASYLDQRLKEVGGKPGNITDANEKLQEEVLKFREVQPQLMDALDGVTKHLADKAKMHHYADVASDGATKVVSNVKDAVQGVDFEKFDAKKVANDLMDGKIQLPNNQHIDLKTPPAAQATVDIVE